MLRLLHDVHMCLCQNSHDNKSASSFSTNPMLSHWAVPELLDKILPFFNDVDGDLQCGLLLLTETFDQLLHRLYWLSINIIQQLLLKLLQPCPQLQRNNIITSQSETSQYYEPVSDLCGSMGLQTNNLKYPNAQTWQDKQPDGLWLSPNGWCCYFLWMASSYVSSGLAICLCWHVKECSSCHSRPCLSFHTSPLSFSTSTFLFFQNSSL